MTTAPIVQPPQTLLSPKVTSATKVLPYLGIPTSTGMSDYRQRAAIQSFTRSFAGHGLRVNVCSLLAFSFNTLYADALNDAKERGVTHFVMLHDDVVPLDPAPDVGWGQVLIATMLQHDLGACCALVAIKHDGETDSSTAIDDPAGDPMKLRRMRLEEFSPTRRVTTTREEPLLLMNTGCLAIDITKPWAERVFFHVKDGIRKDKDGRFVPWVDSEDYNFSRMLRREGVHFGCTSAVRTLHIGKKAWSNKAEG